MRIDVFTLFPEMFDGPLSESIINRAIERDIIQINIHDLREFATDKHNNADDYPYGGGAGMIMKPELIFRGLDEISDTLEDVSDSEKEILLMTPQGEVFNQQWAKQLSKKKNLVFIAGHYKGIDERVRTQLVTREFSIGDYVLTGGELPAMVIMDSVIRLIPGVISTRESAEQDSFYENILDYPHYTRPSEYRGHRVPEVLLSGHHENIRIWRRKKALQRTYQRRPDLLKKANLSEEDRKLLEEIKKEMEK